MTDTERGYFADLLAALRGDMQSDRREVAALRADFNQFKAVLEERAKYREQLDAEREQQTKVWRDQIRDQIKDMQTALDRIRDTRAAQASGMPLVPAQQGVFAALGLGVAWAVYHLVTK